MDRLNRKRKAFLLIMLLVTLSSTGCAAGEISQWKAQEIVLQELENKYGEEFEIRSVEKQNIGLSALKDHIYMMDIYSEEIQSTFHVEIFRDGSRIVDDYEEYKYGNQIENEIKSIERNEDGWSLKTVYARHYNIYKVTASKDIAEYKCDSQKVMVFIEAILVGNNNTGVEASLYDYLEKLQKLGYHISLNLRNGDNPKMRAGITGDNSYITIEQIHEIIEKLEAQNG